MWTLMKSVENPVSIRFYRPYGLRMHAYGYPADWATGSAYGCSPWARFVHKGIRPVRKTRMIIDKIGSQIK